jgi:hypothetical protein
MSLVFLLLTGLWGLIRLLVWFDRSARVAAAEEPATVVSDSAPAATQPVALSDAPSPDLLAAIMIAVVTHRAVRRKQAAPLMRSRLPSTHASRWVMAGRARQNGNWGPTRR